MLCSAVISVSLLSAVICVRGWFPGACFVRCSFLVIFRLFVVFKCFRALTDILQLPLLIAISGGDCSQCSVCNSMRVGLQVIILKNEVNEVCRDNLGP